MISYNTTGRAKKASHEEIKPFKLFPTNFLSINIFALVSPIGLPSNYALYLIIIDLLIPEILSI